MIHFIFADQEPRYLFLKHDDDKDLEALRDLMHKMNLVNPICHLKTFQGEPFTEDFLFEYTQPTGDIVHYASIGLWQEIYKHFKENGIQFDGLMENQHMFKFPDMKHSLEEFKAIVDSWELSLTPRPYQYEAAWKVLQWKRSVSELATRAGKTLIAYMIFRYAIEHLGAKRMLMIVPSIDLVKQGFDDFSKYKEFFNAECIWAGGKLVESANLTIGTFQSLIKFLDKKSKKYNPKFFDGYDVVFVDETHRATAEQTKTIISQPFMKKVKIAFGMTGTIPQEKTIEYFGLKALLGATIQKIKPRQLMDENYISPVSIIQVRLHYKDKKKVLDNWIKCAEYALSEFAKDKDGKKIALDQPMHQIKYAKTFPDGLLSTKNAIISGLGSDAEQMLAKQKYVKILKDIITESTQTNALVIERMMTHFMDERLTFLCESILPLCDKNTLILGHHTSYLEMVVERIRERYPSKHVELIVGKISSKRRDEIKQLMREHNDCILVASYGVMSTGITLSNLCFGVLFESFKSNVINMQSIGRGLGLSDLKEEYVLYDIIDCFDPKVITNKIYLQGLKKIEIYQRERYKFRYYGKSI